jgi:hypothetical protein
MLHGQSLHFKANEAACYALIEIMQRGVSQFIRAMNTRVLSTTFCLAMF